MDQMLVLLGALKNPATMSSQQWILVAGMLLLLLGGIWLVWRLYRIIEDGKKTRYVPNIGRKRLEEEAARKRSVVQGAVSRGSSAASGSAKDQEVE